jgi:hypothetical protein
MARGVARLPDELLRSGYGFHLVLADTGPGQRPAAGGPGITQLSFHATRGLDAIVVIRGGDANDWQFDAEPIARISRRHRCRC